MRRLREALMSSGWERSCIVIELMMPSVRLTAQERSHPELIKASRKRRIATGAGVQVMHVNQLLSQFEQTQKMMKMFSKGGIGKLMRGMKGMLPGKR